MNYSTLIIQLLPEAVLVITALLLLGVAVAFESKTRKTFPVPAAIAIGTLGILLALVALVAMPRGVDSGSPLVTMDPLARLFKGVVLGLGLLAVWLPPARREIPQVGEFYALLLFALT